MAVENDKEKKQKLNEKLWESLDDDKLVLKLLNQGADHNYVVTEGSWAGWSCLCYTVYKNKLQSATYLLAKGAGAKQKIPNGNYAGWSLLLYSLYHGYKKIFDLLLQHGADLNVIMPHGNWKGWSCLGYTVYNGQFAATKALLEKGAKIDQVLPENADEYRDWSLLSYSIYQKYERIAGALLRHGADPNQTITPKNKSSVSLLEFTIENQYIEMAVNLISHGAYPNAWHLHEKNKISTLEYAKLKNLVNLVAAIINFKDGNGRTALHLAVLRNDINFIKVLLQEDKIDPILQDRQGRTPLHLVAFVDEETLLFGFKLRGTKRSKTLPCLNNNNEKKKFNISISEERLEEIYRQLILNLLSNPKVKPDEKDKEGYSLLLMAAKRGRTKLVEAIINLEKFDISLVDKEGNHPLHLAALAKEDNSKLIKVLLKSKKIKANGKNNLCQTPLHAAVLSTNKHNVFALAISDLVDIDCIDKEGNTPLHMAINKKLITIIQILIVQGADLTIENQKGETPFKLLSDALKNKAIDDNSLFNMEIVTYLRKQASFTGPLSRAAQYLVALCYENGWVVEKDQKMKNKWFGRVVQVDQDEKRIKDIESETKKIDDITKKQGLEIDNLKGELDQNKKSINDLKKNAKKLAEDSQEQKDETTKLKKEIDQDKIIFKELDEKTEQLESQLKKEKEENVRLKAEVTKNGKKIGDLNKKITKSTEAQQKQIDEYKNLIERMAQRLDKLEAEVQEKNEEIGELRRELHDEKYNGSIPLATREKMIKSSSLSSMVKAIKSPYLSDTDVASEKKEQIPINSTS